MRTPSEIRTLLREGAARLRDRQAGGRPREFIQKLRVQLQIDVPEHMERSIIEGLAALEAFEESRAIAELRCKPRTEPAA